jgi:hypothetical protein
MESRRFPPQWSRPAFLWRPESLFRLTTIIQTPGYCATDKWVMICEGGMLTLHDPSHPKTRTA